MLANKIRIIFLALVMVTLAVAYVLSVFSDNRDTILPGDQSSYPWRPSLSTDVDYGGGSSIDVKDSAYNINFDFTLSSAIEYPYVTFGLMFEDNSNPDKLQDWSTYTSVELRVKCRPENVLQLMLLTHDDQVTKSSTDITKFRPSLGVFSCGEEWQTARIDLNHLAPAHWWLERNNLNLADRDYSLKKVRAVMLTTSTQSPRYTPSNIIVQEFVVEGKNLPLIYTLTATVLLLWGLFLGWAVYQFNLPGKKSDVVHQILPLAYQSLSIEPKQAREKEAVLDYMACRYSNPDLSVDMAVSDLGINRIKINEILRAETGLTFSLYLNKLRLAEAARLLSDKRIGVAEAAFAVGYNSLSYFNRLFKKEYGCNPSTYKSPATGAQSSTSI